MNIPGGGWNIQGPPAASLLYPASYQENQTQRYVDNWQGIEDVVRRQVTVSPQKYEFTETRKYTHSPHCTPVQQRTTQEPRPSVKKKIKQEPRTPVKQKAIQSADFSLKVKLEIFLEKVDQCVFITKISVDDGKWQRLKRKFTSLNEHPDITNKRTVESAIYMMKKYKTLQVSLSGREAVPYFQKKFYIQERKRKPKPKRKIQATQNVNITNNYYCDAGPSTSRRDDESSGTDDDSSGTDDSSVYSTD